MSVMLKFVDRDDHGMPRKRKQTPRACESCRRSKKRCAHSSAAESLPVFQWQPAHAESPELPSPARTPGDTTSAPAATGSSSRVRGTHETSPSRRPRSVSDEATEQSIPPSAGALVSGHRSQEDDDPCFVGDLNPEGTFLATSTPKATVGYGDSDIGFWLSRKTSHSTGSRPRLSAKRPEPHPTNSIRSSATRALWSRLEDECLRSFVIPADVEALTVIYFEEVHPIFPVVDKDGYVAMPQEAPKKLLLKQAICLAASTSNQADKYIRLPASTSQRRKLFGEHISSTIRTCLELGLVKDKLVLIQVHALLSLFTQLAGDNIFSAELTYRAVSYVHTMGFHLSTQKNRRDHQYVTTLFCCIWVLDRLNASFHGRPVLMHERDIGRDLEACFQQQEGCFQLLLRVTLLLDKVIGLYRPTAGRDDVGWEDNFPPFENLLRDSDATRASSQLLATIETLYHAVAILSCRSHSLKEPVKSSASYVRQCFSATRVTSIVGDEFHGQLSILPVVPYAVSLALRVFYRDLRLSKVPFFRARSRKQLLTACGILRELGEVFSSALVMVELVEETVREMDKVYSSIVSTQQPGKESRPDRDFTSRNSVAAPVAEDHPSRDIRTVAHESEPTAAVSQQSRVPELPSMVAQAPAYQTATSDPTLLDNVPPDLDVFEHFDPDFNLNAIDAVLADNINPSFPTDLFDFID